MKDNIDRIKERLINLCPELSDTQIDWSFEYKEDEESIMRYYYLVTDKSTGKKYELEITKEEYDLIDEYLIENDFEVE